MVKIVTDSSCDLSLKRCEELGVEMLPITVNFGDESFRANIDLTTAINAVTKNPCDLLHINNKGVLKVGYDADIAVFDENMDPIDVYIAGKVVYTH